MYVYIYVCVCVCVCVCVLIWLAKCTMSALGLKQKEVVLFLYMKSHRYIKIS